MGKELSNEMSPQELREANAADPVFTSRAECTRVLTELGIKPGIALVVHTSLASLGTFEGGAENFCRMLQALVTEEGTLMLPGLTNYPRDGEEYLYDPRTTPTDVGIVPEVFRKLPGVVRSWDPTHSFCVWGKNKLDYIRNHHKYPTMHAKSPLGLLEKAGGYCLMVGCGTGVTFMHVVETACHAPCLGSRTEEYPARLPDGRLVKLRGWGWRKGPCRALRHQEIYDDMSRRKALHEVMFNRSHLMLFKLSDYRISYSRLLLAAENGCRGCPVRPRQVQQTVPTDWDMENDRLLPAGDVFTGDFFSC